MLTLTKATLVLAILAAGGNAAAQPAADNALPTTVVAFADLDIGSPAGLRALQGRVHAAALRLCVHEQGRKALELLMAERRCMSAALNSAQAGVDRAVAQRTEETAERYASGLTAR